MTAQITAIAHIYNDFNEKFGIPRQSGLAHNLSKIVFEPQYRDREALRGIEGYSHLWLIWQFSRAVTDKWSPTVRPPRLGGNVRMGVFATRSPFRPNSMGLSSVKLERVEYDTPEGAVLYVSGADILSGTPIFDIKPYLAYTDSHPEALGGFALTEKEGTLKLYDPDNLLEALPEQKRCEAAELITQDPRPQYQSAPDRVYSMSYGDYDISFTVDGNNAYLKQIRKLKEVLK